MVKFEASIFIDLYEILNYGIDVAIDLYLFCSRVEARV